MTWRSRLSRLLATMSVVWCLLVGSWLWFTPIRYYGISNGVPVVRYQSFSDISLFGPAPLIVPVLIAALALWGAWRHHRLVLWIAAMLLAVFTFISGFSIGRGYVPASGFLLMAAVLGRGRGHSAAV